jgi:hypothetical protein
MKKMFTLLVAVSLIASASAQYRDGGRRDDNYNKGNGVTYNDGGFKKDDNRYNNSYGFNNRETAMQIDKINRDYDWKIRDVNSRIFMPRFKKEMIIRNLNEQREAEIRNVYSRFNDHDNHFGDHDNRYGDHDRGRH